MALVELDHHYSALQATDLRVRFASSEFEEVEDFQFNRDSGRKSWNGGLPSDIFAVLQVSTGLSLVGAPHLPDKS